MSYRRKSVAYDLTWQVADRTQRLLDMAEGIRVERFLRDAPTDEVAAAVIVSQPGPPVVPEEAPCLDGSPVGRVSHTRAA